MIEMRWVCTTEEEPVPFDIRVDTFGGKPRIQTVTKKKLQYRQMVDTTVYAGLGPFPDSAKNMQWSAWKDVPEIFDRDPSCP